ncbi:MAG TPA: C4-type zinc ribbon domain-containing protein [bacterium]|nr:C4-type zinc ribbon domain-containing protein [bacterium]
MLKELDQLIELQKIDNQLIEIKDLKGELPQQVEQLENEVNKLKQANKEHKERIDEIGHERRKAKNEIEDLKEKQDKYEDQLYLVTSNKEYDAITAEIETVKKKISENEYNILEWDEEEENLKEQLKSNDIDLEKKEKKLGDAKKKLDKTKKKTGKRTVKLKEKRKKVVQKISKRHLREYNRIAKARGGKAIVPAIQRYHAHENKDGSIDYEPGEVSCSLCYKIVPPQKAVDLRSNDHILRCESCGRLLYWDEDESKVFGKEDEEEII